MAETEQEKLTIGVSSCLLGERVRYDGGHKRDAFILDKFAPFVEFKSFCPEMNIGLGVPREPIRLVMNTKEGEYQNQIRVVGTRNPGLDVTEKLRACAHAQQNWIAELDAYIFKKDSPSCGMEHVKFYKDGHPMRKGGAGVFAQSVLQNNPQLPMEEEGRLNDLRLRENFVQRVYIYREWKRLAASGLHPGKIVKFHSRLKYVLMSRSQKLYRELGRAVASIPKELPDFAEAYIAAVMQGLKNVATRKNHVNVLQHIQGYLKDHIESDDKQELVKLINDYREEKVPLIVPLTLLRHYFRKHPDDYIASSWYISLYPEQLALQNSL